MSLLALFGKGVCVRIYQSCVWRAKLYFYVLSRYKED